jgi:hypothetical protein
VIAHRLATVLRADLIHVVEHGQVVESGSHADLLCDKGANARLHQLQFKFLLHESPRRLGLLASSLGSAHPLLAPAQPETRSLLSVIVQQFQPASLQGAPKLADGGQPRVRPADLKGADSLDTDAALL